jgi:hypothetical protein
MGNYTKRDANTEQRVRALLADTESAEVMAECANIGAMVRATRDHGETALHCHPRTLAACQRLARDGEGFADGVVALAAEQSERTRRALEAAL